MKSLPAIAALTLAASASAQAKDAAEPNVQRTVIQDDGARIEELRVRGQVQRIVVKPKNAAEYEVVAPAGGRDPSQNRANQQSGAGGQRVWNLLKF
jgi:opacity protein-like surface antigen